MLYISFCPFRITVHCLFGATVLSQQLTLLRRCNTCCAYTDNAEDERDSEDEQDVFALEGKTGQELQEQAVQTLDEAAADPTISRGGWEGAAATQDVMPVASTSEPSVVDATADSLDSLMEQTFEHLVWRCNAGQLQRAWAVLLAAFERTLLHTYRSKFTQFLVYYLCQQVRLLALSEQHLFPLPAWTTAWRKCAGFLESCLLASFHQALHFLH